MASQKFTLPKVLAILALVLAAGWAVVSISRMETPVHPEAPKPASQPVTNVGPTLPTSAKPPDFHPSKLEVMRNAINATTNAAAAARQSLAQWRKDLEAMPKAEAVNEIKRLLDSKQDAATHLGFKLASNGWLDEAPTLRTFLLDELARIDPAAAADYAKVILAGMDSPDEWAVALRNLASGDPSSDGQALLQQKALAMLQYEPWQENPSVGYLEAFDVAVYVGGTNLLPTLSSLVQKQDNPAIAHASYLALDRLVINSPTTMLTALESDPGLMQGREATRADYFARADVRDPQQRQVLESYLLNPSLSARELQTFAGIYPNANYMISANLLTQANTPNHDSLVNRDAQSLAVEQQWMIDPRFSNLQPVLQKMTARLQGFVQQENQGR